MDLLGGQSESQYLSPVFSVLKGAVGLHRGLAGAGGEIYVELSRLAQIVVWLIINSVQVLQGALEKSSCLRSRSPLAA